MLYAVNHASARHAHGHKYNNSHAGRCAYVTGGSKPWWGLKFVAVDLLPNLTPPYAPKAQLTMSR